jgi:hypothetical protein
MAISGEILGVRHALSLTTIQVETRELAASIHLESENRFHPERNDLLRAKCTVNFVCIGRPPQHYYVVDIVKQLKWL